MSLSRIVFSTLAAGFFALATVGGATTASAEPIQLQRGVRLPPPPPIICITCDDGSVVCGHDPVCLEEA